MKKWTVMVVFSMMFSLMMSSILVCAEESADITPPKGKISISKDNYWTTFYEDAAYDFELFRDVTFEFTAEDAESGVAKIEYYKSFEVLTLEEAEALADDAWIEGKSLEAKVRDEEQFYLYVRFTDGAGNKSIINTDGIVMHLLDEMDDAVTTGSPVTGQDRVASRVAVWTIMGATILLALTIRRKMTM